MYLHEQISVRVCLWQLSAFEFPVSIKVLLQRTSTPPAAAATAAATSLHFTHSLTIVQTCPAGKNRVQRVDYEHLLHFIKRSPEIFFFVLDSYISDDLPKLIFLMFDWKYVWLILIIVAPAVAPIFRTLPKVEAMCSNQNKCWFWYICLLRESFTFTRVLGI